MASARGSSSGGRGKAIGELHEETNDTKIPRKRHELNGDKSTAIDGLG